jgi:CRISPR/Cas system-associated exonuclease Cas4 (RecB family)
MDINNISVTRAQTWGECHYRYKLRYVLKMTSPEPEPFYFIYGKIIHKIAEEYCLRKGETHLNEIKNLVLEGKIEIEDGQKAPSIPTEYARRMPGMLRAIASLCEQIGFNGEYEWSFDIDLDPPNGVILKGVIDRLILKNLSYFIIDYKTSKKNRWRKTPKSIQWDLQLNAYAWAVQQKFGVKPENIKAALYYLEGINLICTRFTQERIDYAKEELKKTFYQIKNTDPDTVLGNVGQHCSRCDYKTICPFVRGKF